MGQRDDAMVPALALMLAAVFRAPTCHLQRADYTLWLEGPTGVFKTAASKVVMSHYGVGWDEAKLGWQSTQNALGKMLSSAKDAVLFIDDWIPANDVKGIVAESVLRNQGNKQGRVRMNAKRQNEAPYIPRGILLVSAEDRTTRRSANARTINISLSKGEVDTGKLTVAQDEVELLPHAMSAYITWLQPQLNTLKSVIRDRVKVLRRQFGSEDSDHARHAESIADAKAGFELFLRFALESGAIDADTHKTMLGDFDSAIGVVVERQEDVSFGDRPAIVFLKQLDALLASGKCRLEDVHNLYSAASPTQTGTLVGYKDEMRGEWWLLWEQAWREVQANLGLDRIHGTDKAVAAELASMKVIICRGGKKVRYTLDRVVGDNNVRVTVLDSWKVAGLLSDSEAE
jgi:hypothetical protein